MLVIILTSRTILMADQEILELKIPLRLQDYLYLQFWCLRRLYLYIFLVLPVMVVLLLLWMMVQNGYAIGDAAQELYWQSFPGILWPVIGGAVGASFCFPFVAVKWALKKLPRELHVSVDAHGITVFGADIRYAAIWPNLTSLTESRRAYLLTVKRPFVRLPKRGFKPEQRSSFESLARLGAPAKAYKLSSR